MATQFKNKVVKEIGLQKIVVIDTDAATRATIIGLTLANLTDFNVYASVLIHDDTSVEGYFLKNVIVPPNSSLHALAAGEKLILAPENQLYIVADQDAALDAVISYVDIV
jgi:hypothetical protein